MLVLRAKYAATDFALGIVESLSIIPIGLEQFTSRSVISLGFPERIVLGLVRNRWNDQAWPAPFDKDSRKIIAM